MNDNPIELWNIVSDTYNPNIPKSIMEKVSNIFNDAYMKEYRNIKDIYFKKDKSNNFFIHPNSETETEDFISEEEMTI
jgi:hypothetical protein